MSSWVVCAATPKTCIYYTQPFALTMETRYFLKKLINAESEQFKPRKTRFKAIFLERKLNEKVKLIAHLPSEDSDTTVNNPTYTNSFSLPSAALRHQWWLPDDYVHKKSCLMNWLIRCKTTTDWVHNYVFAGRNWGVEYFLKSNVIFSSFSCINASSTNSSFWGYSMKANSVRKPGRCE